jgi:hypothetical protein
MDWTGCPAVRGIEPRNLVTLGSCPRFVHAGRQHRQSRHGERLTETRSSKAHSRAPIIPKTLVRFRSIRSDRPANRQKDSGRSQGPNFRRRPKLRCMFLPSIFLPILASDRPAGQRPPATAAVSNPASRNPNFPLACHPPSGRITVVRGRPDRWAQRPDPAIPDPDRSEITNRWTRVADLVGNKWRADRGDLVSLVVLSRESHSADALGPPSEPAAQIPCGIRGCENPNVGMA